MCRVLCVSRSGYYSWAKHNTSARLRENERLLLYIQQAYVRGRGTYGSPRITAELKDNGIQCGKNRIARLMKENGIKAKTKLRFKATTKSRHDLLVADNLLKRKISTEAAKKVWFSDITFIWTKERWMYLAAILDAYDRQIVGWSMSDRLNHGILTSCPAKGTQKAVP